MTFSFWLVTALGIPLGILAVYIAIRLWSSAFFRSKKEFLTWLKKHYEENN